MNYFTKNKKAIIEGLKELGRLVVFGLPALAIQVISGDANLSAAYGGTILFILRAIDRYVHASPTINRNGMLPF